MDKHKIIEAAIAELIRSQTINSQNYEIVSDANNLVARVDSNFLKVYMSVGNTILQDNELLLYQVTKQPELYKKMLASGTIQNDGRFFNYALFETIKGKTLDEVNYTQEDASKISKTIYDHIQNVGQIQCTGFGDINQKFEGSHASWDKYVFDIQHKISRTLSKEPATRKYSTLGHNLLVNNQDLLKCGKPSIIPVDLNFKNILVTDDNRTVIIDPGALLAGPKEMAYGDVMANSYGTKIFEEFKKHIGDSDEDAMCLYATISLTSILAFITKIGLDPTQAKPFGNPNTFFSLIDELVDHLKTP